MYLRSRPHNIRCDRKADADGEGVLVVDITIWLNLIAFATKLMKHSWEPVFTEDEGVFWHYTNKKKCPPAVTTAWLFQTNSLKRPKKDKNNDKTVYFYTGSMSLYFPTYSDWFVCIYFTTVNILNKLSSLLPQHPHRTWRGCVFSIWTKEKWDVSFLWCPSVRRGFRRCETAGGPAWVVKISLKFGDTAAWTGRQKSIFRRAKSANAKNIYFFFFEWMRNEMRKEICLFQLPTWIGLSRVLLKGTICEKLSFTRTPLTLNTAHTQGVKLHR